MRLHYFFYIIINILELCFGGNKYTMSHFKVLISNPTLSRKAYELLSSKCQVTISPDTEKSTVLKLVPGVDALCWAGHLRLDKEILDAAGSQLKVVATVSAGYDHIDVKELKARGIKFANTPKVLNNAVADTAILLAIGAAKRVTEGRWHLERGTWPKDFNVQWMLGQDITGSVVGIIGLGGIGQAIARRLKGFEITKLLYTGHREKPEGQELGAQFVNLDTLAKESDFVFLAAPLTNETRNMCNADFFSKMKRTSVFVNVSRGELVDQDALVKALREKEIFGAGLDVMVPEPLNPDNELLRLPNVFIIPHLGSATQRTRDAMTELAAQNILRALGGEEMFTPVDL